MSDSILPDLMPADPVAAAEKAIEQLRDLLQEIRAKEHAEMLPIFGWREHAFSDEERRYWSGRLRDIERAYAGPKDQLTRQIVRVYNLLPPKTLIITIPQAASSKSSQE